MTRLVSDEEPAFAGSDYLRGDENLTRLKAASAYYELIIKTLVFIRKKAAKYFQRRYLNFGKELDEEGNK